MKKIILILVIVTLAVTAVLLLIKQPESVPQGADLLPDSSLAYLSVRDFPTLVQELKTSPLSVLWHEPEIQTFLGQATAMLRTNGVSGDWSDLPRGEVFLAVTRVITVPKFELGWVAGLNVQDRHADAEKLLNQYLANAPEERVTYLKTTYRRIRPTRETTLCLAHLGPLLVGTGDEEQMRDIISRFTGNAPADTVSLAASQRFRRVKQNLPAQHHAVAFLNVKQLVSQFGVVLMMAAQASPALQELAKIQASAAAFTLGRNGVTDVGLVTYGKPRTPSPAVTRRTLAIAPADTVFYACHTMNLSEVFAKAMEMLGRSGNASAAQIGASLDQALHKNGIRLADDLLKHLGPEIAYIGNWRTGEAVPDFAVVTEVNNPAALRPGYAKLLSLARQLTAAQAGTGGIEDISHSGETLSVLRTGQSRVSPTLVLTDQYLIIALTTDYARELVTQLKTGKGTLRDAPEFQAATQQLPSGGISLTYCDLRKVIGGIYSLGRQASASPTSTSPLPWHQLPKPETIAKHVGTYASTTVDTADASTSTTVSSLGKPMTLLVGVAGGVAALQPLLGQLPLGAIPGLPKMSSDTVSPPRRADNQTATSRTRPTE